MPQVDQARQRFPTSEGRFEKPDVVLVGVARRLQKEQLQVRVLVLVIAEVLHPIHELQGEVHHAPGYHDEIGTLEDVVLRLCWT